MHGVKKIERKISIMGMFDEFIVDYICPECGKKMHFRSQVHGFDNILSEFYIGDYIDKANVNCYYEMEYAVHCEFCGAYIYDIVFAIRNGQYVDVLSKEEAMKKPIEQYENIEEEYQRKRIYERYCEEMCGKEETDYDSPEKILAIKVGDTVNLLRHTWKIEERFKVVKRHEDLFPTEDISLFNLCEKYVFRASCDGEKRLLFYKYNKLTDKTRVYVFKDKIGSVLPAKDSDYSELYIDANSFFMPLDQEG